MSLVTWEGRLLLSPGGRLTLGPAADECCCVEGCSCSSLPDTLYARLTKYQWVAGDGIVGIESVTWDLTLAKGCPAAPAAPCGSSCAAGSTWFNDSFQERSAPDCSGVPLGKYMMDNVLTVTCVASSGLLTLQACNTWNRLETCPDGYVWRYPVATPNVTLTTVSCSAGEVYATYENVGCVNVGCIRSLIISSSAIT